MISLWFVPALLWALVSLAFIWSDLVSLFRSGRFDSSDFFFLGAWLLAPLAFSAVGRFLP